MPSRKRKWSSSPRAGIGSFLRRPSMQILTLLIVVIVIYLIAVNGKGSNRQPNEISTEGATSLSPEISAQQAYQKYRAGAFVLDVRTEEEWNENHIPNTTLIPLEQLESRMNELPRDREIVVVCRSGNRSQQGRDILLSGDFPWVTSMAGGLKEWSLLGYPIEGIRP